MRPALPVGEVGQRGEVVAPRVALVQTETTTPTVVVKDLEAELLSTALPALEEAHALVLTAAALSGETEVAGHDAPKTAMTGGHGAARPGAANMAALGAEVAAASGAMSFVSDALEEEQAAATDATGVRRTAAAETT